LPGREEQWSIVTRDRVRLAKEARDWPAATALLNAMIAWNRDQASAALATSPADLTSAQRNQIRNLGINLSDLGDILWEQGKSSCLPPYQEALKLDQQIGDRAAEAKDAFAVGNACLRVAGLQDLERAERWFRDSLSFRSDSDRLGRARCLGSLGGVALERFVAARSTGQAPSVLLEHLNAALDGYLQVLDLTPADDHEIRGISEHQLGIVFREAGDTGQALRHFQRSIQHEEGRGNIHGAGLTRHGIAVLLGSDGRNSDALHYARAALDNFRRVGPGAAADVERLIADLEQRSP
jgi:tetratricopeptide (TPR) repeat protein